MYAKEIILKFTYKFTNRSISHQIKTQNKKHLHTQQQDKLTLWNVTHFNDISNNELTTQKSL